MKTKRTSVKSFAKLLVLSILLVGPMVMCTKSDSDEYPDAPENKEQIRTPQESDEDSVPPGHHPDNDDDDPYGGKYDPIWQH